MVFSGLSLFERYRRYGCHWAHSSAAASLGNVLNEFLAKALQHSQERHWCDLPKATQREIDNVLTRVLDHIEILGSTESMPNPIEDLH